MLSRQAKRVGGVWLVAAVLCTAVAAQPRPAWWYASSDHFEAYVAGDETRARDVVARFERVHPTFATLLDLPDRAAPRPRLIVFSSAAQFAPYRANDISNAFWLGTPDGDFIVMRSVDDGSMPDVVHEYTHLMMSRAGLEYPLWLHEGLAEYYSTMAPAGPRMRIGIAPAGAIDTVTRGSFIPVERLFAVGPQSPEYNEPRVAPVFYAEAWALTHMLLSHEDYRDKAGAVLSAIALGASAADAFMSNYAKPPADIESDLRRYVARFQLPSSLVDVAGLAHSTDLTASRAGDVDLDVTLASLLGWRPGREQEARAAMAEIERRAPDHLRLTEARGLLELYTRRCGAARTYLEKAVTRGSANAAVLRAYATILRSSNPGHAQSLMDKAATLAGDDAAPAPPIPCGG